MSVTDRPYAGTWAPNRLDLVQHTPDAIVYLNGDTTISSACGGCNRRIDFQQFITSVSVEASVEASGHSASISFSIPKHHNQSLFTDGGTVIRVGLEVHVYMRGYFPVQGLNPGEVAGVSTRDLPTYPYYHVFHGVISGVDWEYSSGFYSLTANCSSMLHFWNYIDITTNGAVFGSRPSNSQVNTSFRGHNFNGMSPFSIIYSLYQNDTGAAAGVGFAMSSETNNDSVSEAAGDSLFSLVTQYWERRFQGRMYGLRMHGATGQLFTAAQQSFLSRMSDRQIESLLTLDFGSRSVEQALGSDPWVQASQALGFLRRDSDGNVVSSLDLLQQEVAEEDGGLGINIAAMQAFVNDIGQWGSVNLFESSYQSKLDIANEVTRVTGYEFFQDVDGDLVFKPPLYNLNTAPSRVYQIKPIDIISISFSEAEPEATYMIVKGGQYRNMTGMGLDGEFGVRGNYVDYRLVAQFGWRPAEMETNYYNSARSAFFAAVAQLDIINAKVLNTVTITIPNRPEIRPGYPIYIEDIDSYYYVESFSHGFQFGGQCTTTIVGSARRRKFHAPGEINSDGIYSVDLSNTLLPPKPLQATDNEGNPKTVGFPNVVMALDPNQLNPLFLYTALSSEQINDPNVLRLLLRQAVTAGVLSAQGPNGPWTFSAGGEGDVVLPAIDSVDTLIDQANSIREVEERVAAEIADINRRDIPEDDGENADARTRALNTQRQDIQDQRNLLDDAYEGAEILRELIRRTRHEFAESGDIGDPQSAEATLALISDRKASFSTASTPGSYRYYSASHPDPEQQGMREFTQSPRGLEIQELYQLLDDDRPPTGFSGIVTSIPSGVSARNYVEVEDSARVTAGLNIQRIGNEKEVMPTHRIKALSFSSHKLRLEGNRALRTGEAYTFEVDTFELASRITENLRERLNFEGLDPKTTTPVDLFEPFFDNFVSLNSAWSSVVPVLATSSDANSNLFGNYTEENLTFDERREMTFEAISLAENLQPTQAFELIYQRQGQMLADWITAAYNAVLVPYLDGVVDTGLSDTQRSTFEAIIRSYESDSTLVSGSVIGNIPPVTDFQFGEETGSSYQTPVFPVSDEYGYEVVGSYRYGRGLFIEPGANYSQLMELDPLRFADPDVLDAYVEAQLSGGDVLLEAEQNLVEELLSNPSAGPGVDVLMSFTSGKFNTESDRAELIRQGLQNFISSDRDSVHKLPISNAAFALADLVPEISETEVCTCRSALADVQIEALAADASLFVSVDAPSDQVTAWAADQAIQAGETWHERQEALRGTIRARENPINAQNARPNPPLDLSAIAENAQRLAEVFQGDNTQLNDAVDAVDQATDALQGIADDIF